MTKTETLTVRVTSQTKSLLAELAKTHDAAGASALARDILEEWASGMAERRRKESAERVVSYLKAHPEGWADEPADFFPGIEA